MPREHTGHIKHPFSTTKDMTAHGRHQMVNIAIRLIMLFAAKDGEALYSQQKTNKQKNLELTVALIISSLSQNSGLN